MYQRIVRPIGLSYFAMLMLSACTHGTEDHVEPGTSTISFDGQRAAGVEQSFTGGCDTGDQFHPMRWCGDYDNPGFVKDHSFRLWVSDGAHPGVTDVMNDPISGEFCRSIARQR